MRADHERTLQNRVERLAAIYGWKYFHAPDNRPMVAKGGRTAKQDVVPGFPDLVMLRGRELIVAELKTVTGRLGKGQPEWIDAWSELAVAVAWVGDLAAATARPLAARAFIEDKAPRVDVVIWRPFDFPTIFDRLSAGTTGIDTPDWVAELLAETREPA